MVSRQGQLLLQLPQAAAPRRPRHASSRSTQQGLHSHLLRTGDPKPSSELNESVRLSTVSSSSMTSSTRRWCFLALRLFSRLASCSRRQVPLVNKSDKIPGEFQSKHTLRDRHGRRLRQP